MAGRPWPSVSEPLAGLLPAAGGAPHVPVLHPVHLPALSALSPGLPVRQERESYSHGETQWAFCGGLSSFEKVKKMLGNIAGVLTKFRLTGAGGFHGPYT